MLLCTVPSSPLPLLSDSCEEVLCVAGGLHHVGPE